MLNIQVFFQFLTAASNLKAKLVHGIPATFCTTPPQERNSEHTLLLAGRKPLPLCTIACIETAFFSMSQYIDTHNWKPECFQYICSSGITRILLLWFTAPRRLFFFLFSDIFHWVWRSVGLPFSPPNESSGQLDHRQMSIELEML